MWYLVSVLIVGGVITFSGVSVAEDSAGMQMDLSDVLVMLLKQVLPIIGAFFSGYMTKAVLWMMNAAGAKWSPVLTTVIGMITSGISAALLGQSPDMITATAAVGAGTGTVAHAVMQSTPMPTQPKHE